MNSEIYKMDIAVVLCPEELTSPRSAPCVFRNYGYYYEHYYVVFCL